MQQTPVSYLSLLPLYQKSLVLLYNLTCPMVQPSGAKLLLQILEKKNLILQKRALRLIHFKPFRFPAVPLLKLSNVLPLNFRYFKTICLIMHDILKNVSPPNVSNSFTYSSKVHHHNTRFSAAGNFYIKYSRTGHMKSSFSRIGAKIWNVQYSRQ